ncbi:MAG TPA: hypothetical protein VGZ47_15710 [Gemmataceae bacterium]|jgi:hypothetical protein|nr:hypothetical protein [Gemmataceae bacterium]
MTETVTIELPSDLAQTARAVAGQSHKRLEEVLVDWLYRARMVDIEMESLSNEQILGICDGQMKQQDEQELAELLANNREESLTDECRNRLDVLMNDYRQGLLRKAKAWKIAVDRGLRTKLS